MMLTLEVAQGANPNSSITSADMASPKGRK